MDSKTLAEVAEEHGATTDDMVLGAVLAGVLIQMAGDPAIRAMFDTNDRDRFIEGCRSDVTFDAKLCNALMWVRDAVTTH